MPKLPQDVAEMSENRGWRSIHSLLGNNTDATVAVVAAPKARVRWVHGILSPRHASTMAYQSARDRVQVFAFRQSRSRSGFLVPMIGVTGAG